MEGPGEKSAGRTIEIERDVVRVGTMKDNDVVLADDSVSRHHCEILRTPQGWRIRDLESTNGVTLAGNRIVEAYLTAGSVVGLGESRLRVTPVDEVVAVDPARTDTFGELLGGSLAMRQVFGVLERVSKTDATVLITGETGTGKELAARAVHDNSRRHGKPFMVVDCAAVAANLIESELFGHERGSFTGADRMRKGAFEAAEGGTVFLDEIGELPLELQPTLLRVLERREVKRLGSNETRPVDVRVVAATHRDLPAFCKQGKFREDLFFRLAVIEVRLPSLRERREDIPLILGRWIETSGGRISADAVALLQTHAWPGNVRELRNVWERARALAGDDMVEPKHLASISRPSGTTNPRAPADASEASLAGKSLAEIEALAIAETLKANHGNKSATARDLGIAYSTLLEKIKRYNLR
ncbi:MAG TPA: sigma 54-interacting transcriptional regulator [bacterium]|nr:sigma 54-interacting transcriptional regulator [bacterium]